MNFTLIKSTGACVCSNQNILHELQVKTIIPSSTHCNIKNIGSFCCFDEIQINREVYKNVFYIQYLMYLSINRVRVTLYLGLCVFMVLIWFVSLSLPRFAECMVGKAGIWTQAVRILYCLLRLSQVTSRTGPH